MKRILASLFIIVAVVGGGVVATGAFFTATQSANNYTFTTGSASLKLGICGDGVTLNIPCTSPTGGWQDGITFSDPLSTGPGISHAGCFAIKNDGAFDLALTSKVTITQNQNNIASAFLISGYLTDSGCLTNYGNLIPQNTALNYDGYVSSLGTLAAGQVMYLVNNNAWDSTGNQNAMQNSTLKLNVTVDGQTS